MTKNHDVANLVRNDGRLAFSVRGKRLAETRKSAPDGRIRKVLGKYGPFTDAFKSAILNDHAHILERPHLAKELSNYKKLLRALQSPKAGAAQTALFDRLQENPVQRSTPCILCPIWKNDFANDLTNAAVSRYLFPEKRDEVFLLTVVFNFAENLEELHQQIIDARRALDGIIAQMSERQQGVLIFGAFEPDLRSKNDLQSSKRGASKLLKEMNVHPPETGGWVLSGHFIVRVPFHREFGSLLKEAFPSNRWRRVRFDAVHRDKNMAENVMQTMGYSAKYPAPLFSVDTRGKKKKRADAKFRRVAAAFQGPSLSKIDKTSFDLQAAMRQWAEFVDTLGPDIMMYSCETTWAQRWFSQSEIRYIRVTDADMTTRGNLIEPFKGREFYDPTKVIERQGCKQRRLRNRELKNDVTWYRQTDITGVDPFSTPVDLHQWMFIKNVKP